MAISSTKVTSFPQATTVERDALTAVQNGSLIYNTDNLDLEYTVDGGSSWLSLASDLTSLEEAYTVGNTTSLTAARPLTYTIPNSTTPLFDVTNLLNGVDGALVAYGLYKGKNELGASATYFSEEVRYRANLGAPTNIDSGSYTLSVLEDGIMYPYLKLDAGSREITLGKDTVALDVSLSISSTTPAGDPTLDFYANANGAVGQQTLNVVQRAKTDTGVLKTSDILLVKTANEFNATFSQSVSLHAWSGNVNTQWLNYDGSIASYNILANSFNYQSQAGADPLFTVVDNTATGANVNAYQLQVKGLNSASAQIDWFRMQVEKTTQTAGAEGTRFGFYARGSTLGAERLIFQYRGDDLTSNTGIFLMNSDMRMANRSLKEVGNFEASFGGIFNNSQLSSGSVVVKSSGTTPHVNINYATQEASFGFNANFNQAQLSTGGFVVKSSGTNPIVDMDYGTSQATFGADTNFGGVVHHTNLISAGNLSPTGETFDIVLNTGVNSGQLMKMSATVDFQAELMLLGDPLNTPLVGVAVTSGIAGQTIKFIKSGTFRCLADGAITRGDALEKSSAFDGRVMSAAPPGIGSMGIALQSVAAGSFLTAMYISSQS